MKYATAGERLVDAAHQLGLCDDRGCAHYMQARDGDDLVLSPLGHAAATTLLNAFYDYKPELDVEGAPV